MLADADFVFPLAIHQACAGVPRHNFIVDVDVADFLDLMPRNGDDLMQELIIVARALIVRHRSADAGLSVDKLVRRYRVLAVDQDAVGVKRAEVGLGG